MAICLSQKVISTVHYIACHVYKGVALTVLGFLDLLKN